MNTKKTMWIIFGSLAAVILLNLLLNPSPAAYATALVLALFIAVFVWTRSMDDRAFYLILAGKQHQVSERELLAVNRYGVIQIKSPCSIRSQRRRSSATFTFTASSILSIIR